MITDLKVTLDLLKQFDSLSEKASWVLANEYDSRTQFPASLDLCRAVVNAQAVASRIVDLPAGSHPLLDQLRAGDNAFFDAIHLPHDQFDEYFFQAEAFAVRLAATADQVESLVSLSRADIAAVGRLLRTTSLLGAMVLDEPVSLLDELAVSNTRQMMSLIALTSPRNDPMVVSEPVKGGTDVSL